MNNAQKMIAATIALMIGGAALANAAPIKKVGWIGADSYLPFSLYSNVTTKDMKTLLAGHVIISEFRDGRTTHALRITYFGDRTATFNGVPFVGHAYTCSSDARPGLRLGTYHPAFSSYWKPYTVWGQDNVKFPMVKYGFTDKAHPLKQRINYQLVRYDGHTGGLTTYNYVDGRWLRANTGRLQKELPAVIWKLCPKFPSAASLGATVDPRQTAKTYDAVIAQGGTPIRRPDLVTAHTEQKY